MENTKKHKKPATMKDVAKRAGVSQPTVSRVLNQADTAISISDETRNKVLAAIEELSYRPNMIARSLRTQKTQMIAVLIADISNSFYHSILRAIQAAARQQNYDVLFASSDHSYENELHFCEAVTRRPVDGIIMRPIHLTADDLDKFINRSNTPLAVLGHQINHPHIDTIFAQDEQAVYEATRWLIDEKGHRDFGYIGVPQNIPPSARRFRGFVVALEESNLPIRPEHIIESDFTIDGGRQAAEQLLQQGDLPSVLVVANDLMAIGAILTLQDAGYRVPEDIAVLGYDDILEATVVRPTLTTIAQNPTDIGHKLATALFERIENPELPARRIQSNYKLIKRNST